MTNLDSILKSRDITLPTKVHLVKAMVFQVVMYGCKSWVPKNWCFWTIVLEKTVESPLECKEIQPVHPKEISPGCSLEGLMLELKLQYFGHLMQRADSLEKTMMLGKIEDRRRSWWQKMRWLDGITDSMDMGLGGLQTHGSWWWRRPGMLWFMGLQKVRHDWATELYWTETVLKVLLGSC